MPAKGANEMVYLGIQNTAVSERVVLLPDDAGKAGVVVVTTAGGEQVLSTAYASAQVSGRGQLEAGHDQADQVRARYALTLAALPPRPESFTVYFASGSSTELTAESGQVLSRLKAALATWQAPEIAVIGHTDRVGRLEDNDTLSVNRATTVRAILAGVVAAGTTVGIAGRGEREPLVPTADEVPEALNRRVEINLR
jgi:outer membrane protein OmpA-like peptidoglycan-associated protein